MDFIDQTEQYWRNRGLEWSPESTVQNFQLSGPRRRAEALDMLDAELRNIGEIPDNAVAMRRAADMVALRQTLDDVHHSLLKVNR